VRQGFGGVVPTDAEARGEGVLVCALALEHHAEGAALGILVLAEVPGMLRLDVAAALRVVDDRGTVYAATPCSRVAGLGSLQTTAWLTPAVPPEARALEVTVTALQRVSVARGGTPVVRPLTGGPWALRVDLRPPATAAPPPPRAAGAPPPPGVRIPARALTAWVDRVPVGQARFAGAGAVCLWSLERYVDRAVLSLAALAGEGGPPSVERIEAWDDRGAPYRVSPVFDDGRDGWLEAAAEITPAPRAGARVLAVRVLAGPPGAPREHLFGVALGDGG